MSNTEPIFLMVLCPERTLLETHVSKVELPGSAGRFTVLKDHAPLISSLDEGEIVYVHSGDEGRLQVKSGFVEIVDNRVVVCAEV